MPYDSSHTGDSIDQGVNEGLQATKDIRYTIATGVDVDILIQQGDFTVDTNLPGSLLTGLLSVGTSNTNDLIIQTCTDDLDKSKQYFRKSDNLGVTWGTWKSSTLAVVDTLISTSTTTALSANQGRVLHELILNGISKGQRWKTELTYDWGDVVSEDNVVYVALTVNAEKQPSISPSDWRRYEGQGGNLWEATLPYRTGDWASINNIGYVALAPSTNQQPDVSPTYWEKDSRTSVDNLTSSDTVEPLAANQGRILQELRRGIVWLAERTYEIGDTVTDTATNRTYIALTSNTNSQPSLNPTDWRLDQRVLIDNLNDTGTEEGLTANQGRVLKELRRGILHNFSTSYIIGDTCTQNGAVYVALTNNSGKVPDVNPLDWELDRRVIQDNLTSTEVLDVLSANQGRVLNEAIRGLAWSSLTNYSIGDVATESSKIYIAKTAHTNSQPSLNPLDWELQEYNFLELTDTPSTYTGYAGMRPTVKEDESGIEFLEPSGQIAEAKPTGLIDGGQLSVLTTNVTMAAGMAQIVDSYTQPHDKPGNTLISWPDVTVAIANITPVAGDIVYIIAVLDAGAGPQPNTLLATISQYDIAQPSPVDVRDGVYLGYLMHNGTEWGAVSAPIVVNNTASNFAEYVKTVSGPTFIQGGGGVISSGIFNMDRAAGINWELNRNWHNNRKDPDRSSFAEQLAFSWRYVNQNFVAGSLVNSIDAANYDNAGTIEAIPGTNEATTIQRLYVDPLQNHWVMYGQVVYDTFLDATARIGQDTANSIIPDFFGVGSILLGYIITQKDQTTWVPGASEFFSQSLVHSGGNNPAPLGEFRQLNDTPESFIGQSLRKVRVNATETALEFYDDTVDARGKAWEATHDYDIGDIVSEDLVVYVAITASTNSQPSLNPTDWQLATTLHYLSQAWFSLANYKIGNIISEGTNVYIAKTDNTNLQPSLNPLAWRRVEVVLNNTLTSTSTTEALTANMGKSLQDTKANKAITVSAGTSLTGGGDLSANRTISHLDTAGNKHIPAAGTANQVLGWLSAGVAQWVDQVANTWRGITDSVATTSSVISASATAVKLAYDTGNHAHPYLPVAGKAADSEKLDNLDSLYFRTNQGSTTLDPNLATAPYTLTHHVNSPDSTKYWHIRTQHYSTPSTTSNRGQIAIEYNPAGETRAFVRSYFVSAWTAWTQIDNTSIQAEVDLNTAKVSNVTTNLSKTTSQTDLTVNSSDGTNVALGAASTLVAGVMTKAMYDEHVLNNAKVSDINHNVTTNLSVSYSTIAVTVNSSDGTNGIINAAATGVAGVMTGAMYDQHILNNAKVSDINHNVTTNLGYIASTTNGVVTSSDGTNATLPLVVASGNAGLMTGADKTKLNGLTNYTLPASVVHETEYASSTVGGTLKANLVGSTLYLTNNGTTAGA